MTEEFNQFEHALTIAENNLLNVSPRPSVGAVIFKDNKVLGEGVTDKSPGNHAEINALEQCKNSSKSIKNATLFTTLEPCFHKGQTGPCVDKIIESGITKIVVGEIDPNPKVNGKSIKKLLKNNIEVVHVSNPDQMQRSKDLIEPFKHFINSGMPYVTSKIAISLDGKIATKNGDSKWISSEQSRKIVQNMRSLSDAIIIGSNTLHIDKPSLDAKDIIQQPKYKVVLNSIPKDPKRFETLKSKSKVLVYCKKAPKKIEIWDGIEFIEVSTKKGRLNLIEVLKDLGQRGCVNILVEGGGQLTGSLIDLNLINKMRLFISPMLIGGVNSAHSVGGEGIEFISQSKKLTNLKVTRIETDIMVTGIIKKHV